MEEDYSLIPDISDLAKASKQLPDNHKITVSNIEETPLIEGFATENTLNKLVETKFVGNKTTTPTEDATNKYYTQVGTTNTTGITTKTITINKTTGVITEEWS